MVTRARASRALWWPRQEGAGIPQIRRARHPRGFWSLLLGRNEQGEPREARPKEAGGQRSFGCSWHVDGCPEAASTLNMCSSTVRPRGADSPSRSWFPLASRARAEVIVRPPITPDLGREIASHHVDAVHFEVPPPEPWPRRGNCGQLNPRQWRVTV